MADDLPRPVYDTSPAKSTGRSPSENANAEWNREQDQAEIYDPAALDFNNPLRSGLGSGGSRIPRRLAGIGAPDLPDQGAVERYIGPPREVIIDADTVRVHNGVTPGGIPLARDGRLIAKAAASSPATETQPISGRIRPDDGFAGHFVRCNGDPDPNITSADKFQDAGGSWWVRDEACHLRYANTPDPAPQGFFTDKPNPPRIHRTIGRLFGGLAAEENYGTAAPFELPSYRRLTSWIAGWRDKDGLERAGPGSYLEIGAGLLWISRNGATAITAGTRQSDRFTQLGYELWKSGETVAVGAKRYWANLFFVATTAGVCGAVGPTHESGTATDGGVSWQNEGRAVGAPIAFAAVAVSDVLEPGAAVWASYTEAQREHDGNTIFAREIAVKNKGSNVHNNPYNRFPGGATIGDWFAGGGDPVLGAPAAPSTVAIMIGFNGAAWNKGIVFGDGGISSVGSNGMVAIALAKSQRLCWFTPESAGSQEGSVGAFVDANVTETAKKTGLTFENDVVRVFARTGFLGSFENGAGANSPSYLRFISGSGGQATINVGSPVADADLALNPKGAGLVRFGTSSAAAAAPGSFSASRSIKFKQSDGTVIYVPCTTSAW